MFGWSVRGGEPDPTAETLVFGRFFICMLYLDQIKYFRTCSDGSDAVGEFWGVGVEDLGDVHLAVQRVRVGQLIWHLLRECV